MLAVNGILPKSDNDPTIVFLFKNNYLLHLFNSLNCIPEGMLAIYGIRGLLMHDLCIICVHKHR